MIPSPPVSVQSVVGREALLAGPIADVWVSVSKSIVICGRFGFVEGNEYAN